MSNISYTRRLTLAAIGFAVCIILTIIAYLLHSNELTIFFWITIILLSVAGLFFELNLLTVLFDLLSEQPVIATAILLITVAGLVMTGLFLRWLLETAIVYWLISTIFPAICGIIYVVDMFQKDSSQTQ
ncbi:hypothetical protein ACFLZN_02185 [Nanoarchaeota archaeon]